MIVTIGTLTKKRLGYALLGRKSVNWTTEEVRWPRDWHLRIRSCMLLVRSFSTAT